MYTKDTGTQKTQVHRRRRYTKDAGTQKKQVHKRRRYTKDAGTKNKRFGLSTYLGNNFHSDIYLCG